jgi:hypothetical protein
MLPESVYGNPIALDTRDAARYRPALCSQTYMRFGEGRIMSRRVLTASLPLWLLAAGCMEESHSLMVKAGPSGEPVVARSLNNVQRAPATEEAGKRVISVGQKIVTANPQLGLRPAFCTAGTPDPEIFHRGTGGLEGCQIIISEGLVRRCTTDAQLAAVLCQELGKIVAEREAQDGPALRQAQLRSTPEAHIGNDYNGAFGPSDGTYLMEQGKLEKQRRKPGALPVPEKLAKQYLVSAGYAEADLAQVQTLLYEAEKNFTVEKSYGAATSKQAVAAPAVGNSPLAPRDAEKPVWKATPANAASPQ